MFKEFWCQGLGLKYEKYFKCLDGLINMKKCSVNVLTTVTVQIYMGDMILGVTHFHSDTQGIPNPLSANSADNIFS